MVLPPNSVVVGIYRSGRHICRPYAKQEIHIISLKSLCRDAIYRVRFRLPRYCVKVSQPCAPTKEALLTLRDGKTEDAVKGTQMLGLDEVKTGGIQTLQEADNLAA